ncbi:hypothetical protein [Actinokineospora globicatena]|uniref:hypothetical protein n=1 Tax=Actinokineospora globicatena TaxID=103729 RepID=UPI0020A6022E|nr:hypothetical protein [Actinokineospora globicatena]MCP2304986.1 hypothetical protein [Actinokineospora globicatena]GLW80448.1 hypothetical protein Aglo01_49290 [Actinokineospora globicatena]GLW87276.1 hypothetical protein Aglo02_49150 [Actinokineospora globicatena]
MRGIAAVVVVCVVGLVGCTKRADTAPVPVTTAPFVAEFADAGALGRAVEQTARRGTAVQADLIGDQGERRMTGAASIELDRLDPTVRFTLDTEHGDLTVLALGGMVYATQPGETDPSKLWLEIDQDNRDNPLIQFVVAYSSLDPQRVGAAIAAAGTTVVAERDHIAGRELTRYTVQVAKAKLDGDAFWFPAMAFKDVRGETFTTEVWVEPGGRIARYQSRLELTKGADFVVKVDYHHWGDLVNIEAPSPGQVERK